jgi:hypothetical protein
MFGFLSITRPKRRQEEIGIISNKTASAGFKHGRKHPTAVFGAYGGHSEVHLSNETRLNVGGVTY